MNILETIGASAIMGTGAVSTTMSVSPEGDADGLATATAFLSSSTTAAIISNGDEIHNVHESIAYVESLDENELQQLEAELNNKSLEFFIPQDDDSVHVFVKK